MRQRVARLQLDGLVAVRRAANVLDAQQIQLLLYADVADNIHLRRPGHGLDMERGSGQVKRVSHCGQTHCWIGVSSGLHRGPCCGRRGLGDTVMFRSETRCSKSEIIVHKVKHTFLSLGKLMDSRYAAAA